MINKKVLTEQAKTNTKDMGFSEEKPKDIYLSNESNTDKEETKQTIEQNINNNIINKNDMKMLSFRIPQNIIDNIDKYSYVQRMKKQDLIIKCFETFFDNEKAQNILKEYDKIKGEVENDK